MFPFFNQFITIVVVSRHEQLFFFIGSMIWPSNYRGRGSSAPVLWVKAVVNCYLCFICVYCNPRRIWRQMSRDLVSRYERMEIESKSKVQTISLPLMFSTVLMPTKGKKKSNRYLKFHLLFRVRYRIITHLQFREELTLTLAISFHDQFSNILFSSRNEFLCSVW